MARYCRFSLLGHQRQQISYCNNFAVELAEIRLRCAAYRTFTRKYYVLGLSTLKIPRAFPNICVITSSVHTEDK